MTSTPTDAAGDVAFNPDVKAWTGSFGDGLGIANAEDECILLHVELKAECIATPGDIRTVAIDPENNVFVGGYYANSLFKVNGATGQIIKAAETKQGHYGGVVDKQGNLWSMSSGSGKVQRISSDLSESTLVDIGHSGYGIAIDKYGKIWTTEYGSRFSAFHPDQLNVDGSLPEGALKVFSQQDHSSAQGVATDDNGDVFIAGSLDGSTVGHYKQVFTNGVFTGVEFVRNYPVGNAPTGVAVDADGHVWSSNYSDSSVSRIVLNADPQQAVIQTFPVGSTPYNYSDMTGRVVRTITNRQGTWEATVDAGKLNYQWDRVLWTLKQALPANTDVVAFVKAANTQIELGALDYVQVENDKPLSGIKGQYLKVRIRLTSGSLEATPEVVKLALR